MTPTTTQTNTDAFESAQSVLVGGVDSPVRSFKSVGGTPKFIQSAQGARFTDVEGKSYIDYVLSWGPLVLGHAHPKVVAAVQDAATRGTSFGAPSVAETELARVIQSRIPSCEKIRFVSSGTEATMAAIRLARGITGRPKIIKFSGGYHGASDSVLVAAGSGASTLGIPDSAGILEAVAEHTLVVPYNDLAAVKTCFDDYGRDIAGIIVEPVCGNIGVVKPVDGFLAGLRQVCDTAEALLIFDEVMTGFRVALGGAQALYGVRPDLTCLGKVIGGGLPCGAIGGPAGHMDHLAPLGPVYQAGTLSGNPITMAAGLATLTQLSEANFDQMVAKTKALVQGLQNEIKRNQWPLSVQSIGSMFTLYFRKEPVLNMADASSADHEQFRAFYHQLLERGVYFAPSPFEANFMSIAHSEADIDKTLSAVYAVLESLYG